MKLKDALENYYFHSGKTSDLVRQLALAGIAVIWLFKYEVTGVPKVPAQLLLPLGLIVCGLALDNFNTWSLQLYGVSFIGTRSAKA